MQFIPMHLCVCANNTQTEWTEECTIHLIYLMTAEQKETYNKYTHKH